MKKSILSFVLIFSFFSFVSSAYAGYVNGYYRSNGTYVNGYYRSDANSSPYDNYSYPGNYNPYTGKIAPGNPDTYLNNYYGNSYYNYDKDAYKGTYDEDFWKYSNTDTSNYSGSYSSSSYDLGIKYIDGGYFIGSALYCNSGYYKKNNNCTKAPSNSTAFGLENFYCNDGYVKQNNECVKITPDELCQNSFGQESISSNQSLENTLCICQTGYEWTTDKKSCQPLLVTTCPTGTIKWDNSQCVTPDQVCQYTYGSNTQSSSGIFDEAGSTNCNCKSGYQANGGGWVKGKNVCFSVQEETLRAQTLKLITKPLQISSKDSEVSFLQEFLKQQGFYSGPITGYFGKLTQQAVKSFQKYYKIDPTGKIDLLTRAKINSFSLK